MMYKALSLAALAGMAFAQSSLDLMTVLNSTEGLSSIAYLLQELPEALDAIAGRTNLTILAPNDTAIASIQDGPRAEVFAAGGADYLLNTLLYHVIDGGFNNITDYVIVHTFLTSSNYTNVTGGQYLGLYYDDDEDVIGAYAGLDYHPEGPNKPIPFSQGWIYVINDVLEIPPSFSKTVTSLDFNGTSFVEALNQTGLLEEADELKDATYFVPVNDAFSSVECSLSELSSENLTEVLKYHIVQGKVWHYDDIVNGTQLTTLSGQNVTLSLTEEGELFINNAGIVYTDLAVFSGVVFFIDNVLNPDADWSPPVNGTEDGVPAFSTCETGNSTSTAATASATESHTSDHATAIATSSASIAAASSTFSGMAMPMQTGAIGAAALFGGAALAFAL